MKNKKGNNKAVEPLSTYSTSAEDKSVHIFASFDAMEADNYKWLASLSPEQHLQNATALIKRIFAEDLKQHPKLGTTITFN